MRVEDIRGRFMLPDSDDEIARIIERKPRTIEDLGKYPIGEAGKRIEFAMKDTHTPTAQEIRLIRQLAGKARAYVDLTYSSEDAFRTRCHLVDIVPKEPSLATALIGLAGAGKSQLFCAIERLLNSDETVIDVPELPKYPFEAVWTMRMVAGKTLSQLLAPFVGGGLSGLSALRPVAKRAYTNGVGLVFFDETQFITATQAAHAKAANEVMRATYLGPPLVYGANFTMINKLENRPQQERDRLLSDVLALYPESKGSDDHVRIVKSQLAVLAEATADDKAVKAENHADAIHDYTYGINRKSALLLNIGLCISKEQGSCILTMDHIKRAYESTQYAAHRADVELLMAQQNSGKKERLDLWSSYAPPPTGSVLVAKTLIEDKRKRVAAALTRSTMTKEAREDYDEVMMTKVTVGKSKSKVVVFPKPDKSLAGLQAAGAAALDEFVKPQGSP